MPNIRWPRRGSMQFWPRVRAKRSYALVRSWAQAKDVKMLGFAGYKVGMTHVLFVDPRKNSKTKGENVSWPVTIIECPPIKVYGFRLYLAENKKKDFVSKGDKELKRKIKTPKKEHDISTVPDKFEDLRLLAYTQPKLTGIGNKKPELFEVGVGGSNKEKLDYAKSVFGKEIPVTDVFVDGQQVDSRAITRGKGFQGPVKRFGVKIRQHKSEKTKRGPGSLGGWRSQGHVMYRVAHAGGMGYHQRTDFNKILLKISNTPEEVNPKGGFIKYGLVKNQCILVKGSIQGPVKRIVRINAAIRPNTKFNFPVTELKIIKK